jgi:hypothetical protein
VDTSWCNDTQAADDALEFLRLKAGDIDEERVQRQAVVACGLLAQFLDRHDVSEDHPAVTDAVELALLREAHGKLTAELYLRKDAPFGIANAFDDAADSFRIGSDPLAGVRRLAGGLKVRWGVA